MDLISPLPDFERLYYELLTRDIPDGADIASTIDDSTSENFPVVRYTVITPIQVDQGIWSSILSLYVFGINAEENWELCTKLYESIHGWETPGNGMASSQDAAIAHVNDISAFTRAGSSQVMGKTIVEYDGQFSIMVQS